MEPARQQTASSASRHRVRAARYGGNGVTIYWHVELKALAADGGRASANLGRSGSSLATRRDSSRLASASITTQWWWTLPAPTPAHIAVTHSLPVSSDHLHHGRPRCRVPTQRPNRNS
jgi:hypothetical protein